MSHSFEVLFNPLAERQAREIPADRVLTPVDRYTGRIVAVGIAAEIPAEWAKARRSLRGHLIFERLRSAAPHVVEISTGGTGYFQPGALTYPDPQDFQNEAERLVRLDLRPDFIADGSAAIARGAVRRAGIWVDGARVRGNFIGEPDQFETRTNEKGAFALRLRPPAVNQAGGRVEVPFRGLVVLAVEHDGQVHPVAEIPVVKDMQTTTLDLVIDLPAP